MRRRRSWGNRFTFSALASVLVFSLANEASFAVNEIPLRCLNNKTFHVRVSDVVNGCEKGEVSLGASAIPHPLIRPTKLDDQVFNRFQAARVAAKKDGETIAITSGFRTLATQKKLFARAIMNNGGAVEASKWVAPPLLSHHPWGIAIDVNYPSAPLGAGWLEVNGWKFGLCRVYENEWWHFEPVIAPGEKCPELIPDATYSHD